MIFTNYLLELEKSTVSTLNGTRSKGLNITIVSKNLLVKVSELQNVNTISTLNGNKPHSLITDGIDTVKTIISLSVARANIFTFDPNQLDRRLANVDDVRYHISSNPIRLQLKCTKSLNTRISLQTNNNEQYGFNINSISPSIITNCSVDKVQTFKYDCKYQYYTETISVTCSGKKMKQ